MSSAPPTSRSSGALRLTVAVCTHNPKPAVLARTLAALRAQSLPTAYWELLLVDNDSTNGAPAAADLAWHPHARRLHEPVLGIAAARQCAVAALLAGPSPLLLFVDDDNLLAPDYLATGLALADADPRLACWGGQLLPEYEVPPPEWFGPFARYLAVFPLAADRVVEAFTGNHDCLPPTAGMFVRRETLRYHQQLVAAEPLRLVLGGRGGLRIGGEDTDLALAALEAGGRVGRFAGLRLVHLIPAGRLTLAYLEGLIQGIRTGTVLVHHLRGRPAPPAPGPLLRLRQRWQLWRLPEVSRRLCAAEWRGEAVARHLIATTPRINEATRS